MIKKEQNKEYRHIFKLSFDDKSTRKSKLLGTQKDNKVHTRKWKGKKERRK